MAVFKAVGLAPKIKLKLLDKYKSKPLDKEAVRESYKIFTKPPAGRR